MPRLSSFALMLVAAMPASAQDRPLAVPTRDVDVTYRSQPPGAAAPMRQRVRWDVAGQRERIDPPRGEFHVILDLRGHRLFSVRDSIRAVLEMDATGTNLMPDVMRGEYELTGGSEVDGLACRLWRARPNGPRAMQLCVTDDGVMLRASIGEQVLAEAERVTYAPADPADFVVPPDYRRIAPGEEPKP